MLLAPHWQGECLCLPVAGSLGLQALHGHRAPDQSETLAAFRDCIYAELQVCGLICDGHILMFYQKHILIDRPVTVMVGEGLFFKAWWTWHEINR